MPPQARKTSPRASQGPVLSTSSRSFSGERHSQGRPPPRTYLPANETKGLYSTLDHGRREALFARPAQRRDAPSVAFAPFTITDHGVHHGAK